MPRLPTPKSTKLNNFRYHHRDGAPGGYSEPFRREESTGEVRLALRPVSEELHSDLYTLRHCGRIHRGIWLQLGALVHFKVADLLAKFQPIHPSSF